MSLRAGYLLFFLLLALGPPVVGAGIEEGVPMSRSWQAWQPAADPAAMVVEGQARFTVLTPRLVRMEWSPAGSCEDRASLAFVNRRLPVPAFTLSREGDALVIDTGALRLRYRPEPGPFSPENLSATFSRAGAPVTWRPGLRDSLNLEGTTRTLDSTNGAKDVVLEDGILSRSGWALVDDSARPLLDDGEPPWVAPRPAGERQDWYLFAHGLDFRGALGDFVLAAGRIPMPPRFALGWWWSRYWAYADDELRALVDEIQGNGLPLDVLVIDMDWHTTDGLSGKRPIRDAAGELVGWTGYTWNRDLFPEPRDFLAWVHGRGLRVALNLHPASGVPATEERYADFAAAAGYDARARQTIPYRLEDRRWAEAFFARLLRPLEDDGVDFWWLDWQARRMNPAVRGLDQIFWLNHVFACMAELRGEERPLLFHRWGGLGNHRYQVGFSGDSYSTWEALAFQPRFTATASNVGYGWWSHDIGGHQGEDADPELYLRWLQFGALSPILRTHSTKDQTIERRFWMYPAEYTAMRAAVRLRYALAPYIYTAAREAYDTGVSLCRPMFYDHPQAQPAYEAAGQYMFGPDLIASPVTIKADRVTGLAAQRTWLPPGDWHEWSSGALLAGDRWVERAFTRSEIPLYARAGSILPLYPPVRNLATAPDTLVLACVPGGAGRARIYEDDGRTSAYRTNACAWTEVDQATTAPGRRVRIHPRVGRYDGMPERRAYEVRLLGVLPPVAVRVNGRNCARAVDPGAARVPCSAPTEASHQDPHWWYDGTTLTACVATPALRADEELVIEADLPALSPVEALSLLDGTPGLFARLAEAMPEVKREWNRLDPIANPPAALLRAGATARRIAYAPDRALEILRGLRETLRLALDSLAACPGGDPTARSGIAARIGPPGLQVPSPTLRIEPLPAAGSPAEARRSAATGSSARVILELPPDAEATYTLDGSLPTATSTRYVGPFTLTGTTMVRARAFAEGRAGSFPAEASFQRRFAQGWTAAPHPSAKYAPLDSLFDGRFGSAFDFHSAWCGWEGDDLALTVDLSAPAEIRGLRVRFLRDQRNWIFLPVAVRYEVCALDGTWSTVYSAGSRAAAEARDEPVGVREHAAAFTPRMATRIRITAENVATVPAWHRGAGGRAWVFADEIVAE